MRQPWINKVFFLSFFLGMCHLQTNSFSWHIVFESQFFMVCVGLPAGFLAILSFFMSAPCRPSPSDTSLILRVWPF